MKKRGNWSVEELTKLRASFGRRPVSQLVRELRRSEETILHRAQKMFSRRKKTGPWTQEELRCLSEMIGCSDLKTMALVLGRPPQSVLAKLRSMSKVKQKGRFSEDEILFLKTFGPSRPDWSLAIALGRDVSVLRRKAKALGLGKDKRLEEVPIPEMEPIVRLAPQPRPKMPRWSPEECQILRERYPKVSNLQIARALNRSVSSIVAKANELRLKKDPVRLEEMGRENAARRRDR
jgi:hypothetical protein